MNSLWARLAAGVPQRVERWPGNDGEDIIKDTTAANHLMIEAANRISQLEAALDWIAALGYSDLHDLVLLDAKATIIERLRARARDALNPN